VLDLLIRGATVVDGTGGPARTADVAVTGERIVEVGRVSGRARRTVDADGLLLTPGFVDIHTHYDGQATWDGHLTPSCWHGVTTAILGNCGVGFAPVRPEGRAELIELMEGVEDIPGTALSEGIDWQWEGFGEYLDALDRMPRALDIGTHVPHAAVRCYVMGARALQDATDEDLQQMQAILAEGLQAGALGFSTGRTAGHRDLRGRLVPGTLAPETELSALLSTMSSLEKGVLQVVPAGVGGAITGDAEDAMEAELAWIVRCGVRSRRPLTFLAMQRSGEPEHWRPWFAAVADANARGAVIRPQVANRCFGVLMGHSSRLNPFRTRATYAALAALPLAERLAALSTAGVREQILAEEPDRSGPPALDVLGRRSFENLFPLGDRLDYEPTPERSVAAIARQAGRDVWEVAYDLLLEHDGRELFLLPLLNYGGGSYDGLHAMMSDPNTVQGLGDGGAHVGLVCDASMTTYMLTHWARDRTRGPQLDLPTAVRRLTHDPARLYGLGDRGVIRPGLRADLNLIDHAALRLLHPEQVNDLPGGAGRLVQRSEGYLATIVAGQEVVRNGELTDARPGRVVRGARSAG
jgi:N-acyl-D-amino-acid deacylase